MVKILLIEDEEPLRKNVMEMLMLEGAEAFEAANGRIGISLAQTHKPDLIICDIMMPEMDGYEVLERIRQDPMLSKTPFIFLTARADRSFMRHGMELGADDYLTKPFTFTELRTAIQSRLSRLESVVTAPEQDLSKAKQTLIQLVAHELRTPLISINMVTDIVLRQLEHLSTKQIREMFETLERGAQRLNRLVEQTVYIVQLETNALNWEAIQENNIPVNLSELLMTSVDLARRFAYRSPDVSVHLDERDQDIKVLVDTRAFRHALSEIITNAVSFSPEHGQVLISQWQADDAVWISILDKGPGIPKELLEDIFKPFYQVSHEKQEQQGIGLGLPLSRRIIEAHGGTLTLNSVVGKGTQVTISLPLAEHDPLSEFHP